MKRVSVIGAAVAIALAGCAPMSSSGPGWTTLIDGANGLQNFNRVGDANWRAEGGAIVADNGKTSYLVTKDSYRDFEIRAEFYAESDTNSGIFLRCQVAACYEVNIWDLRPDPKYGTAAIVDYAAVPVPAVYKAGGKWNTFEITAKGDHLIVKFNGTETVNVRDNKHAAGRVLLQYGTGVEGARGGVIKWRKVQVRPL